MLRFPAEVYRPASGQVLALEVNWPRGGAVVADATDQLTVEQVRAAGGASGQRKKICGPYIPKPPESRSISRQRRSAWRIRFQRRDHERQRGPRLLQTGVGQPGLTCPSGTLERGGHDDSTPARVVTVRGIEGGCPAVGTGNQIDLLGPLCSKLFRHVAE